jgi:hypothetical protein
VVLALMELRSATAPQSQLPSTNLTLVPEDLHRAGAGADALNLEPHTR